MNILKSILHPFYIVFGVIAFVFCIILDFITHSDAKMTERFAKRFITGRKNQRDDGARNSCKTEKPDKPRNIEQLKSDLNQLRKRLK